MWCIHERVPSLPRRPPESHIGRFVCLRACFVCVCVCVCVCVMYMCMMADVCVQVSFTCVYMCVCVCYFIPCLDVPPTPLLVNDHDSLTLTLTRPTLLCLPESSDAKPYLGKMVEYFKSGYISPGDETMDEDHRNYVLHKALPILVNGVLKRSS